MIMGALNPELMLDGRAYNVSRESNILKTSRREFVSWWEEIVRGVDFVVHEAIK